MLPRMHLTYRNLSSPRLSLQSLHAPTLCSSLRIPPIARTPFAHSLGASRSSLCKSRTYRQASHNPLRQSPMCTHPSPLPIAAHQASPPSLYPLASFATPTPLRSQPSTTLRTYTHPYAGSLARNLPQHIRPHTLTPSHTSHPLAIRTIPCPAIAKHIPLPGTPLAPTLSLGAFSYTHPFYLNTLEHPSTSSHTHITTSIAYRTRNFPAHAPSAYALAPLTHTSLVAPGILWTLFPLRSLTYFPMHPCNHALLAT